MGLSVWARAALAAALFSRLSLAGLPERGPGAPPGRGREGERSRGDAREREHLQGGVSRHDQAHPRRSSDRPFTPDGAREGTAGRGGRGARSPSQDSARKDAKAPPTWFRELRPDELAGDAFARASPRRGAGDDHRSVWDERKPEEERKDRPGRWDPRSWANRFEIAPGDGWDGIDRSNGHEARFLRRRYHAYEEEELAHDPYAGGDINTGAMDEYGERQDLGFDAAQRQSGMPSGEMLYRGLAVDGEESSDGVLGKDSGSVDELFVERGSWKEGSIRGMTGARRRKAELAADRKRARGRGRGRGKR